MVGLAALEEGVVSEDTVIVDQGKITVPNQYYPGISYDFVGWKRTGLGPVTIRSAIARSSDIYFYIVGGGHPSSQVKPLGIARLSEYYRRFSLGKLTGLDLPGEKPGVVADPAWKAEFFKSDPVQAKWYLGDTYHVSIGQGDMLVTPLQVAVWTATIANGGSLITPHLATGILDADGKEVKTFSYPLLTDKVGNAKNVSIIQQAMRQTVLTGSAQPLNKLPITSAGKTGTSQFDASDPNLTHAWFTAYAPYEKPEIAISVLVEAGGEGHAVAVPITKAVLEWWSQNRVK
jgi:penicillin-binding protein 2